MLTLGPPFKWLCSGCAAFAPCCARFSCCFCAFVHSHWARIPTQSLHVCCQSSTHGGDFPPARSPARPGCSCRAADKLQLASSSWTLVRALTSETRLSGDSRPFTRWAVSMPEAPCCDMVAHGRRVGAGRIPSQRKGWVARVGEVGGLGVRC